jgi:phosphoribosylcarboxyaminoimidazole (NCAIR) mutase
MTEQNGAALVGVVMGSKSDYDVMSAAVEILRGSAFLTRHGS